MATEFKLPELGENIESADIIKVHISPGDTIEVDQIILEIETDKATVEVPSEVSGKVKEVNVKDGDKAKVGDVIFTFESVDSGNSSKTKSADDKNETSTSDEKHDDTSSEEKSVESETDESDSKNEETVSSGSSEFRLPDLGENIESADIIKVLINDGDNVEIDQAVIEIETDKATVEVPSEISGKVTKVYVKDGDKAKVGDLIFEVEGSSKDLSEKESGEPKTKENKTDEKKDTSQPLPSASTKEEKKEKQPWQKREMPEKIVPAAPSVRRFAREIGIDIHQVSGNGPGGRIAIDDVKAYAKSLNEQLSKGIGTAAGIGMARETLPDFSKWGEIKREPMTNIRRKTAEHLSYAWATIPHVTQFDKADITELETLRKKYSTLSEKQGGKLTITAILLKVVASALKKFPQFNSSIDMEKQEIIYKHYLSIGIAVDTDRGLLVPVIRDVDKKNIVQLAAELNEISIKARDKKLSLEDMQGGNFSISNLGGIGGTSFTPIVNSPEVAILGVSRGSKEAVFRNGEFEPRLMLPLSLSYDHRIIDGADAARFLRWIVEALENPFFLMLEG